MDPLSLIANLAKIIQYFEQVSDVVKENGRECQRLASHMREVLTLVEVEHQTRALPADLIARLRQLQRTSSELRTMLDGIADEPLLKRIVWRDEVRRKIASANRNLQEAVQTFELGTRIDLRRFQAENEEARRRDADAHQKSLDQIQMNDHEILRVLGVQRTQMQEAMMTIQRRLLRLDDAVEHRFLESGLHALQRRSGGMKMIPDEFVITPFDIIVYYERKLGEGAYAKVFQGEWRGSLVAVKMMDRGTRDDILQKEVDVWKRLKHPHILQFFGACSIADPPFIVSALKEGDASHYLRKYPSADRVKLIYEASAGLDYLHGYSVIHGDLKACNILIDEHGMACIADFGLSRIKTETASLTYGVVGTAVQGTARWMAPEHMARGVINKPSDIYSFGMTAYEIFTDAPPFTNVPDALLFTLVVEKQVHPSRPDNPAILEYGLGDDMWALLMECWANEPAARPLSTTIVSRLSSLSVAHSNARKAAQSMGPVVHSDASTKFNAEVPCVVSDGTTVTMVSEGSTVTLCETPSRQANTSSRPVPLSSLLPSPDVVSPASGLPLAKDALDNAHSELLDQISRANVGSRGRTAVQPKEVASPVARKPLGLDFQILPRPVSSSPKRSGKLQKKVVLVGDGCVGKTTLCVRWIRDEFVLCDVTVRASFEVGVKIDQHEVEIELCDIGGVEEYDRLRHLTYPGCDVAVICFNIGSPDSFANVTEKWSEDIKRFLPSVPIILAGLQMERRHDPKCLEELRRVKERPVTYDQGVALAEYIGATAYGECSAETAEGVKLLLQLIAEVSCGLIVKPAKPSEPSKPSKPSPFRFWRKT